MATTEELLARGATVDFDTYAPMILSTAFKACKVLSLLDFDTVRQLGQDPAARHNLVYPYLPKPAVDDPTAYLYVKLQLPSGAIDYIGLPWIDAKTIETRQNNQITLIFADRSPDDLQLIIDACSANGFKPTTVKLDDTVIESSSLK